MIIPHSLEIERAVIGQFLLEPGLIRKGGLKGEDFYDQGLRRVYEAMDGLFRKKERFDLPLLADHLTEEDFQTANQISSEAFTTENFSLHVSSLRDLSAKRKFQALCVEAAAKVSTQGFEEVSLTVKNGSNSGLIRVVLPSLVADRICQETDQPEAQKTFSHEPTHQGQILKLIGPAAIELEARLSGAGLTVRDFLDLAPGDLLAFNHPVDRPLDLMVEGVPRFAGKVKLSVNRRVLSIESRSVSRETRC